MSVAPPASTPDALQQLASTDPGWDPDHFLEFAEMAFFLQKKAMQERDPAVARAFLADTIYQGMQQQTAAYKNAHRVPVYDGLWVKGLYIEGCRQEAGWNFVYVVFQANAALYDADEATGQLSQGSAEPLDFTETWTFSRVATAVSKVGGGVMEYKCPNCSAPLTLNDVGVCQHCGAPVASGQLDWVVVGIA